MNYAKSLAKALRRVADHNLKTGPYGNRYTWSALPDDNPKVTGFPDNRLLNRSQGYEIRDFINHTCEHYGRSPLEFQHQIEHIIHSAGHGPFTHAEMRWLVASKLGWRKFGEFSLADIALWQSTNLQLERQFEGFSLTPR